MNLGTVLNAEAREGRCDMYEMSGKKVIVDSAGEV